jgi:hypothetical protein
VGAEFFHADGQTDERTDRHDEASHDFTNAPKNRRRVVSVPEEFSFRELCHEMLGADLVGELKHSFYVLSALSCAYREFRDIEACAVLFNTQQWFSEDTTRIYEYTRSFPNTHEDVRTCTRFSELFFSP